MTSPPAAPASPSAAGLASPLPAALADARARSLALVDDLDDAQWLGPRLAIVNPILWEMGHLGWFQEYWTLRHARGAPPLVAQGDALYDSAKVAHDTRWDLPLLPRAEVLSYLATVLERALAGEPGYFHELALNHEDMHGEALLYTRQTLAYPAPALEDAPAAGGAELAGADEARSPVTPIVSGGGPLPGDVEVPGCRFLLGAPPEARFVFDNEKWAHPVAVAAFRIARAPVTNEQFLEFVEEGGYRAERWWSREGWRWRAVEKAEHPVYWSRRDGGRWTERQFRTEAPLLPHRPAIHVCWYEADAYCRWAGRRLPTEAEWELAAATPSKRRFPWGDAPPDARHANLDAEAGWTVDVSAHAAGDSAYGCRQLIGNVWEWTASDFRAYPGFVIDPYKEYSAPWFSSPHKVLRGGCWATRARLLRNTWRNFYPPDRRDVLAGFRTCA